MREGSLTRVDLISSMTGLSSLHVLSSLVVDEQIPALQREFSKLAHAYTVLFPRCPCIFRTPHLPEALLPIPDSVTIYINTIPHAVPKRNPAREKESVSCFIPC